MSVVATGQGADAGIVALEEVTADCAARAGGIVAIGWPGAAVLDVAKALARSSRIFRGTILQTFAT